jgi:transcriptional regulator with XRE-family HTH domain
MNEGIKVTLGEKLRAARNTAGLTQQDLAEKLLVSRQAITKWENDSGIPDIDNLKALAALFDVSVDYLVAGDDPVSGKVMREAVDLSAFKPKRRRKLLAVQARYPKATQITELLRTVKRRPLAWIIELVMPVDFIRAADSVERYAAHYLVDLGDRQILATVTNDHIESRELTDRWDCQGVLLIGSDKYWPADKTLRNALKI